MAAAPAHFRIESSPDVNGYSTMLPHHFHLWLLAMGSAINAIGYS